MKRKRRSYTEEFKREAVKLVTEHGCKVPEAARSLGIHESMLRRWKNIAESTAIHTNDFTAILAENKCLKEKNKHLQIEKEILKKTVALFAREEG